MPSSWSDDWSADSSLSSNSTPVCPQDSSDPDATERSSPGNASVLTKVEEALVTWEQSTELDARSCWRELRKVADAILTMTEGEHLSVCRPTLLKSLVSASAEESFAERCCILHLAFLNLRELIVARRKLPEDPGQKICQTQIAARAKLSPKPRALQLQGHAVMLNTDQFVLMQGQSDVESFHTTAASLYSTASCVAASVSSYLASQSPQSKPACVDRHSRHSSPGAPSTPGSQALSMPVSGALVCGDATGRNATGGELGEKCSEQQRGRGRQQLAPVAVVPAGILPIGISSRVTPAKRVEQSRSSGLACIWQNSGRAETSSEMVKSDKNALGVASIAASARANSRATSESRGLPSTPAAGLLAAPAARVSSAMNLRVPVVSASSMPLSAQPTAATWQEKRQEKTLGHVAGKGCHQGPGDPTASGKTCLNLADSALPLYSTAPSSIAAGTGSPGTAKQASFSPLCASMQSPCKACRRTQQARPLASACRRRQCGAGSDCVGDADASRAGLSSAASEMRLMNPFITRKPTHSAHASLTPRSAAESRAPPERQQSGSGADLGPCNQACDDPKSDCRELKDKAPPVEKDFQLPAPQASTHAQDMDAAVFTSWQERAQGMSEHGGAQGTGGQADAQEMVRIKKAELAWHEVLGQGVFGKVWRATYKGSQVAVKCLNRGACLATSNDLHNECAALRDASTHTNIVRLLGVCDEEEPADLFMVTELVAGVNLSDLIRARAHAPAPPRPACTVRCAGLGDQQPQLPAEGTPAACHHHMYLSASEVAHVSLSLASALHHLADLAWVHCDVKSANVLISSDWSVKLCDFGLAIRHDQGLIGKALEGQLGRRVAGSAGWAAPEVLKGLPPQPRADVFSLGVVMWEMLSAGQIPWHGKTSWQVRELVARLKLTLHIPRAAVDRFPAPMIDTVRLCWTYNAALRPAAWRIESSLQQVLKACQDAP